MLEEKRKDLNYEKRKKLITRLVGELSAQYPDLYYQPTSQIAHVLKQYTHKEAKLFAEERELLSALSEGDIAVLLSYN